MGSPLTYTVAGKGSASFYAPATSGLGVGGHWVTYTAQMHSGGAYGIGVQGAVVTVNGQEYTGTLVLVTSEPASLAGFGHTLAPNFANRVTIQAQDVKLLAGSASASSLAKVFDPSQGWVSLSAAEGLALSGYRICRCARLVHYGSDKAAFVYVRFCDV